MLLHREALFYPSEYGMRWMRFEQQKISRGQLVEDQFWLLIELAMIRSDKTINALKDYLVSGETRKAACERHNVSNGYLSTSLSRLYRVNYIVTQLIPYYGNR